MSKKRERGLSWQPARMKRTTSQQFFGILIENFVFLLFSQTKREKSGQFLPPFIGEMGKIGPKQDPVAVSIKPLRMNSGFCIEIISERHRRIEIEVWIIGQERHKRFNFIKPHVRNHKSKWILIPLKPYVSKQSFKIFSGFSSSGWRLPKGTIKSDRPHIFYR